MNMDKDEIMFQKRLIELSRIAYTRGIVTFSDFMNLNELNILHTIPKHQLQSRYETYGGYHLAERQMVAFLPDALYYDYHYPFQAIEISPVNQRFAEELTHRDYLGAVMNLGIERCKLGDIMIDNGNALMFLRDELVAYITDNLTRIRHTSVQVSVKHELQAEYEPKYEEIRGTVASVRLDTVLSLAYPLSRSKLTACIESGRVFVNGKLITSNGYRLKEGDIISVRKMGRIIYDGVLSETKKGRYLTSVRKYL